MPYGWDDLPVASVDRELRDAIPSFPCEVERDMHVSHSASAMLVFSTPI
jgi:hypothetical protein